MTSRLCKLVLLFILSALACSAQAALQDFINGRMVGKRVEPMQLKYYADRPESLENKVVLIDFWAVWCEPCRFSMPELNRLHAEFGKKGLAVVGVTRDDDKDIAEFVKRIPMDFYVGTDIDGAYFKRLSVRAMPYAVLADRNGNIIWQGDPSELKRERIEAALAAPPGTRRPASN
jgi:thiol-disulfide isomerase/thioredoxin